MPEVNPYPHNPSNPGDGISFTNSMTVVFHNKGTYIAPMGLSLRFAPYALMFLCGAALTVLVILPARRKRREA